jgi:hypothetical protein
LSEGKKQIFLAFVSHSLTVHGRAFGLDLAGEKQIAAFKGLNELHHQLSSQIARSAWAARDILTTCFGVSSMKKLGSMISLWH